MSNHNIQLPDEATNRFYEESAQATFERMQAVQPGAEHYAQFLSLVPTGGHILDAGSGSGRDSLFFIQHGYTVTAMDASEALGKLASQILGQPVLQLTFEEMSFENCFDGVWASLSLLHVSRSNLVPVLTRIGRALRGQNKITYIK